VVPTQRTGFLKCGVVNELKFFAWFEVQENVIGVSRRRHVPTVRMQIGVVLANTQDVRLCCGRQRVLEADLEQIAFSHSNRRRRESTVVSHHVHPHPLHIHRCDFRFDPYFNDSGRATEVSHLYGITEEISRRRIDDISAAPSVPCRHP
jgi:hypothetical protein